MKNLKGKSANVICSEKPAQQKLVNYPSAKEQDAHINKAIGIIENLFVAGKGNLSEV